MQKRAEMMQSAKEKLEAIRPRYEAAKKEYEEATRELVAAEASFDVGEKVKVEETCYRGCCVETEYFGTIQAKEDNGSYSVLSDGYLHRYVSGFDMRRVG